MTRSLSSTQNERPRLPLLRSDKATLDRHPKDGWVLAAPYPMGSQARRGLRALISVLCPSAPVPRPDDFDDRIETTARRFMRYMHPVVSRGFWLLVLLLDVAPLFIRNAGRRLHQLDRPTARAVIHRLAHSRYAPLRTAMAGVRGMILSAYFDQREVHEAIGYRPVPFIRSRLELRTRLMEPAPVAAE